MIEDDNEIPKHRSNKKTRKWCKGKEGREHKPIWEKNEKRSWSNSLWMVYRCTQCLKEMEWYYEGSFLKKHEVYERPEIGSSEPLKLKEQK